MKMARRKEYTDTGIGVCLTVEDDGYTVMLHRTLNVETKKGCILEADTFQISGEGYSRDMPEYRDIGDPGLWNIRCRKPSKNAITREFLTI